jgi:hypothetical protein
MQSVELIGPIRDDRRNPIGTKVVHEKCDKVEGRGVGPVEVLDHKDDRGFFAKPRQ